MRDVLIVGVLCVVVLAAGAFFFLNGDFLEEGGSVPFSVIAQGQKAEHIQERVNYRIKSATELRELWFLIHGGAQPTIPVVDFDKNEVLAIFDGSHTSGGFDVHVRSITDEGLVRIIAIEHREPGPDCVASQSLTSPYELVVVPKMPPAHRLERTDTTVLDACE